MTAHVKGDMTLSITTFSTMTLSIKDLYVALNINDTQSNNVLPIC
jgi:hypothetical protein